MAADDRPENPTPAPATPGTSGHSRLLRVLTGVQDTYNQTYHKFGGGTFGRIQGALAVMLQAGKWCLIAAFPVVYFGNAWSWVAMFATYISLLFLPTILTIALLKIDPQAHGRFNPDSDPGSAPD